MTRKIISLKESPTVVEYVLKLAPSPVSVSVPQTPLTARAFGARNLPRLVLKSVYGPDWNNLEIQKEGIDNTPINRDFNIHLSCVFSVMISVAGSELNNSRQYVLLSIFFQLLGLSLKNCLSQLHFHFIPSARY